MFCIHSKRFWLSHFVHFHWIQTQFICSWAITVYLFSSCHWFAIISMFIVQAQYMWPSICARPLFSSVKFRYSASVFTDSLPSSIISITTHFLLLSHLCYTCSAYILNHIQFLPAFGYLYNFPPYNALPYIYFHNVKVQQ